MMIRSEDERVCIPAAVDFSEVVERSEARNVWVL